MFSENSALALSDPFQGRSGHAVPWNTLWTDLASGPSVCEVAWKTL